MYGTHWSFPGQASGIPHASLLAQDSSKHAAKELSFGSPGTGTPPFWAGHLSEPVPAQQQQPGQQHQHSCLEGRSRKGRHSTDTAMSVSHAERGQNVLVPMDHIWGVVCVNSLCKRYQWNLKSPVLLNSLVLNKGHH